MRIRKLTICSIVMVMSVGTVSAATDLPAGWRAPKPQELVTDIDWRKDERNRYLIVSGDFDGDKKQDFARLLVSDSHNAMGLFVILSSSDNNPFLLNQIPDKRMIQVIGIALAKPGKYKTACGKGYFPCAKGEPAEIYLRTAGINYFKEGSANSFFVWDRKVRKFRQYWMSD